MDNPPKPTNRNSLPSQLTPQQKKIWLKQLQLQFQQMPNLEQASQQQINQFFNKISPEDDVNSDQDLTDKSDRNDRFEQLQDQPSLDEKVYFLWKRRKQFTLLILISLLVIVRITFDNTQHHYKIDHYQIFETRYQRSFSQGGWKNRLLNWIGIGNQVRIYLPLHTPTTSQLKKNQMTKDYLYLTCLHAFTNDCIYDRLELYGSVVLELQEWAIDHFRGNQKILVEATLENMLTIVLLAQIFKSFEIQQQTSIYQLIVIAHPSLSEIQLTSLKLSLIENNCQSSVIILPSQPIVMYQRCFLKQFDYLLISSLFFNEHIFINNFQQTYEATSFVVLMPLGMDSTIKYETKGLANIEIIEFSHHQGQYYTSKRVQPLAIDSHPATAFTVLFIKSSLIRNKLPTKILKKQLNNQPNNQSSNQLAQGSIRYQKYQPTQFSGIRSLQILPYNCSNKQMFHTLDLPTPYLNYIYYSAIDNYNLLISSGDQSYYQNFGCRYPDLYHWINSVIRQIDQVVIFSQYYPDDLLLFALAKNTNKGALISIYPQNLRRAITSQNLQMNSLKQKVNIVDVNPQFQIKIKQLFESIKFNFIFIACELFSRDYHKIIGSNQEKMLVIFEYNGLPNFQGFINMLVGRHRVHYLKRVTDRNINGECLEYEVIRIKDIQKKQEMMTKWVIVQI